MATNTQNRKAAWGHLMAASRTSDQKKMQLNLIEARHQMILSKPKTTHKRKVFNIRL